MIMGVRLSTHFIIFPVISTPDDFDITDPVLPGTYHRPYSSYNSSIVLVRFFKLIGDINFFLF